MNNSNKIDNLKRNYAEHLEMPFPELTSHQDLQSVIGELSLYGGHIAGLVSSYIDNSPININLINTDPELEETLANFHPINEIQEKEYKNVLRYKHKIDEMAIQLQELVS